MGGSSKAIVSGRHSATIEGDFVVFLIGARANRWWRLDRVVPIVKAFRHMQRELARHPELGCLGAETRLGRTILSVQYWRSYEHLERFARDETLPHLEPWRRFNRTVAKSGDIGIYHETFLVKADQYEAIYVDMPPTLLARAVGFSPIAAKGHSSRRRLGRDESNEPFVPVG